MSYTLNESFPQCHCNDAKAYRLSVRLGQIFTVSKNKQRAFKRLAIWYNEVEDVGIDAFKTLARSVQQHINPS